MRIKMVDKVSGVELAQFESEVPRVGETLLVTVMGAASVTARWTVLAVERRIVVGSTMLPAVGATVAVDPADDDADTWLEVAKSKTRHPADPAPAPQDANVDELKARVKYLEEKLVAVYGEENF